MPLCPFRNIDSIGHIDCGCKGKPEVYACSHPETGDYCLLHAAGKPFQRILFKDGSEKRIGTAAERKEITVCSFCEHKPCPDDLVDPPKPPETTVQPPPPVPTAVVQPEKPRRNPVKLLKVEKRPEQPVQLPDIPGLPPGAVVVDTFEEKAQLPVVLAEKKTPRVLKTSRVRRIEQPKQAAASITLPPLSQQPTLSIVCADCNRPELGLFALEKSLAVPHERALFFSHIPPLLLVPDIEWHYVPVFKDINDYNLFVLRELHKHIATTHVLTVQHDGYVLHPDKWQEEWLDFDYIGAVWPADRRAAEFSRVGNSGFCLRSQRLLKATAELATDGAIESHRAGWNGKVYDDVFTCHDSWHTLTAAGARFAPIDTAEVFAIERREIDTAQLTTFGFHGKNASRTVETESPDSRNDEEQAHEMFSLEQRETILQKLHKAGDCAVTDLRTAANCADCKQLLAEFEKRHFVKKRWLNKAYRYSITGRGRDELTRIQKNRKDSTAQQTMAELTERLLTQPETVTSSKSVTLVCVDCVDPNLAVAALDMSRKGCEFARVLLLSDKAPKVIPEGIDFVQIPSLDLHGYQLFCLRELWKWTHTSHVLTIETDGWVLRPEKWNDAWLQYDYIGAPWQKAEYSSKSRVGNSGCCLRSRRLLQLTANLATDERLSNPLYGKLAADIFTCYNLYDELVDAGIAFASPEIAAAFSVEKETEFGKTRKTCFGYHGRDTLETMFLRNRFSSARPTDEKIRVVYNRYTVADENRQRELDRCLEQLQSNPHIANVIIVEGRPSFTELFEAGDHWAGENDVTVVLNSDCYFDHLSTTFLSEIASNEFWCLTRHEETAAGWQLWDVSFSQDAWIYRGKSRLKNADFLPGTVGCDNKLAFLAVEAGYDIQNPARTVKLCHLHRGEQRTMLPRLRGTYVHIHPHTITERAKWKFVENQNYASGPAVWRGE